MSAGRTKIRSISEQLEFIVQEKNVVLRLTLTKTFYTKNQHQRTSTPLYHFSFIILKVVRCLQNLFSL